MFASRAPPSLLSSWRGGGQAASKQVSRSKRFYNSYAWRKVRYRILADSDKRCSVCGASPSDGYTVLQVDHIEPISKAWDRRLGVTNLRVACGLCNHGKLDGPA
jgi:5-methylcytosine-specific restriction endonuclease McrA